MAQTTALINTLKRTLKAHGKTYVDVGHALGLSEASVKRLFSREDFSLERLDESEAPFLAFALQRLGHGKVAVLNGGVDAWVKEAKLPLASGAQPGLPGALPARSKRAWAWRASPASPDPNRSRPTRSRSIWWFAVR